MESKSNSRSSWLRDLPYGPDVGILCVSGLRFWASTSTNSSLFSLQTEYVDVGDRDKEKTPWNVFDCWTLWTLSYIYREREGGATFKFKHTLTWHESLPPTLKNSSLWRLNSKSFELWHEASGCTENLKSNQSSTSKCIDDKWVCQISYRMTNFFKLKWSCLDPQLLRKHIYLLWGSTRNIWLIFVFFLKDVLFYIFADLRC